MNIQSQSARIASISPAPLALSSPSRSGFGVALVRRQVQQSHVLDVELSQLACGTLPGRVRGGSEEGSGGVREGSATVARRFRSCRPGERAQTELDVPDGPPVQMLSHLHRTRAQRRLPSRRDRRGHLTTVRRGSPRFAEVRRSPQ